MAKLHSPGCGRKLVFRKLVVKLRLALGGLPDGFINLFPVHFHKQLDQIIRSELQRIGIVKALVQLGFFHVGVTTFFISKLCPVAGISYRRLFVESFGQPSFHHRLCS